MKPTQQDILDNVPLVRRQVHAMKHRHTNSILDEDDLFSEGIFGLFKAFELWDPEKSSWKTFATRKVKYAMIDAHRCAFRQFRQARNFGLPEPTELRLDAREGGDEILTGNYLSEDETIDIIDSVIGLEKTWGRLSYRQRHIMKLMFGGMTQQEVAEVLHVTPTIIYTHYHRAIDKIKRYHGEAR